MYHSLISFFKQREKERSAANFEDRLGPWSGAGWDFGVTDLPPRADTRRKPRVAERTSEPGWRRWHRRVAPGASARSWKPSGAPPSRLRNWADETGEAGSFLKSGRRGACRYRASLPVTAVNAVPAGAPATLQRKGVIEHFSPLVILRRKKLETHAHTRTRTRTSEGFVFDNR